MSPSVTSQEARGQLLRAVTTIYLVLPCLLFASGWLRPSLGWACALGLGAVVVVAWHEVWRAIPVLRRPGPDRPRVSASSIVWGGSAGLLILVWLFLSGAGGFGYQNSDYRASNALLRDLITRDWPLTATVGGSPTHIVYYVGYYLPAAAVGRQWGWQAANSFLFLWTVMGVALSFAWFVRLSRVRRDERKHRILLLAVLFCLSGGLDCIGYFLLKRNAFDPTCHMEWWAAFFQYSSNTTLLYWVPQHTLVAWLLMGMVADAFLAGASPKYLGMAFGAGVIWSPFAVVGAAFYLPLLLIVYLRPRHRRLLLHPVSLVFNALALGVGSIFLLYLRSNQFAFPMGLIWRLVQNRFSLAVHLLAFWCLEFALLGGLILLLLARSVRRSPPVRLERGKRQWGGLVRLLEREFEITRGQFGLFVFALAVLTLLPLFSMGYGNDLVMRASVPSLFFFWAFVAKVVMDAGVRARVRSRFTYALSILVVMAGFFPSATEIMRSVKNYHLGPPDMAAVPTTENANVDQIVLQRMGREDSMFFRYLGK